MTPDELIATLSPSRLPPSVLALDWRALLALLGLGLLAGAVIAALLAPFLARRVSRKAALRGVLRATAGDPPQERLLTLARHIGHLPEALRPAAYGAVATPDDAEIERLALAALARQRRETRPTGPRG